MRKLMLSVALILGLTGTAASGRSASPIQADFSGTWVVISGKPIDDGSPVGTVEVITQNPGTITFSAGNRAITYRLDGVETQDATGNRRVSKTQWISGALLVTTRTSSSNAGSWESAVIWARHAEGELIAVQIVPVTAPDGAMATTLLTYHRR